MSGDTTASGFARRRGNILAPVAVAMPPDSQIQKRPDNDIALAVDGNPRMTFDHVFTDGVIIGNRMRELDEEKVAALAESMRAIGLQQPISVWVDDQNQPHLVAGRHRLAAAIKLGWEEIDCVDVRLNEVDRQIWEIDENLYRKELSADEMREHLRRRKDTMGTARERASNGA